jgi:hypothetical protein
VPHTDDLPLLFLSLKREERKKKVLSAEDTRAPWQKGDLKVK